MLLSHHNSFALIASAALGGGKNKPSTVHDPDVKDVTKGAPSAEAAIQSMNRMLRMG